MSDLLLRPFVQHALEFATEAHRGQTRKYTGEPYINHPISVAHTVSLCHGATEGMVAAALLHDVVEDCGVTIDQLDNEFGAEIAVLVRDLTDSAPKEWSRKQRKHFERQRLSKVGARAQTIKLADLIDNTLTIVPYDPQFAQVYLVEKRELLKVLDRGDPLLRKFANDQIVTGGLMLARLGYQLKEAA